MGLLYARLSSCSFQEFLENPSCCGNVLFLPCDLGRAPCAIDLAPAVAASRSRSTIQSASARRPCCAPPPRGIPRPTSDALLNELFHVSHSRPTVARRATYRVCFDLKAVLPRPHHGLWKLGTNLILCASTAQSVGLCWPSAVAQTDS